MPMPALYSAFCKVKSAITSFLLVAPLMLVALSLAATAPDAASAQERQVRLAADDTLQAVSGFRARLKALEEKAASFKPEGRPLRAKVDTTSGGSSAEKRIPARLTHRDRAATDDWKMTHLAAIRALHARVNALEKEARGHEMGHNLDMPPAMAAKKKTGRSAGERVNNPSFGAGLSKKSQALERDIAALEREARAIYKKPGRLK